MDHFSSLSPDGSQLLLAEMGFNGWESCRLVPYDGASAGRKVGPERSQCTAARWSPDGRWMYFAADAGGGFHIWRQRFPDGNPEQLTFGTTEEEGIEFAPDGRSFLTAVGTRQSTLWVHDSRGDRQITSDLYAFLPTFSADASRLYYLVRAAAGPRADQSVRGSLWVARLDTGERQRLLPDYLIEHYSVSDDGRRAVFVGSADTRTYGVWVAALDGRFAPRRLSDRPALQAFFGAGRDVYFAATEKDGTHIYCVNDDGSDLRRVPLPQPVYFLYGVSPDGRHLAAWVKGLSEDTANSVMIYPTDGGDPVVVSKSGGGRDNESPAVVSWSRDGKSLYIALWKEATFALPVTPGTNVPHLPPNGLQSPEDAGKIPGARRMAVPSAFAGPDPSIYAYAKVTAQRNIYRVTLP